MIETILPSEQESRLARESGENLAGVISDETRARLRIQTASNQEVEFSLPLPAVRVLLEALNEMGQGHGVALTPVPRELTTQQAADLLRVSRPFLISELLDKGKITFRKVGNRRRIRYVDLLRYQREEEQEI